MDKFERLAEQYRPMMYKIIYSLRIYKNIEHYHSIALQALWEASVKYDGTSSKFSTFAYTIMRGRLLNELQYERRYDQRNALSSYELLEYDLQQSYSHDYLMTENIHQYCEHLTDNQKRWVIHTFLYDHSLNDICAIYNVDKTTVKSWRKTALKRLRKQLLTEE